MKRSVLWPVLVWALALVMLGCAPKGAVDVTPTGEAHPTATAGSSSPTPEDTPASPAPGAPQDVPEDAAAPVAWAKRDLAARLKVAEEAIAVSSVEAVDWSDSSLGCPQEGYMYLQVITPGYRLLLEAGGETYEYHSARGAPDAVYCDLGKREE